MQAIRTRFYGPTDSRGSRITASCEHASTTLRYDHALTPERNHEEAMLALRNKVKWNTPHYTPMIAGQFKQDYYWVFTPRV